MTLRYVGAGGNDGNSGLNWGARKLTLNGAEDSAVVAGDIVYVGPGVYRELLTVDVSGANAYSTGTVSLTNGSATVTGSGTSWLANVAAAYIFHATVLAHGTDGVGVNGGNHFTSAAGNFQAGHVGMTIRINTIAAYVIESVISATEITCGDTAGTDAAFTGQTELTYDVGPEEPYDVASVTDNTHLELTKPWYAPTFTGLAYLTYNPIRYVGDVTGEHTDGVGGLVRITGSDNDQTATRANAITANSKNYRLFQGFELGTTTNTLLTLITACSSWLIQDCVLQAALTQILLSIAGTGKNSTVRRCLFLNAGGNALVFTHSSTLNDCGHLVDSCIFSGGRSRAVNSDRIGGIIVRNCLIMNFTSGSVRTGTAVAVGQAMTANNNIITNVATGLQATVVGEILEDYNDLHSNTTDRTNVTTGAHSITYPPLLSSPLLLAGFRFPWFFGELSKWSQVARLAGFNPPGDDLFGLARPVTDSKKSWGAIQATGATRETTTVQAGAASLKLADAGEQFLMRVPISNVSTTISLYCYREAHYAGTNPQMILRQPGQADRITTDAGAASGWNQLTDTFTPAALPPYVDILIRSNNTAAAGSYASYFDTVAVS